MTGQNTNNLSDAIRNLIVCDTQFGWTGETTLKLPELLDLQARGWLIEGDENCEFSLTDEGQAVVARALQQDAPTELAEQQGSVLSLADHITEHLCQHEYDIGGRSELMACVTDALAATGKQQGGDDCQSCKGSGEGRAIAGSGPDVYEVDVLCSACGGTGAPAQQVGEVQGDALASLRRYRMAFNTATDEMGLYEDDTGSYVKLQDVERALAATALPQRPDAVTPAMVDAACKVIYADWLKESKKAYRDVCRDEMRAALEAALAARQPGAQEPVGFQIMRRSADDTCFNGRWDNPPLEREYYVSRPGTYRIRDIYAAPPAQGIDLGPVRSALQAAEGLCACCASVDGYSRNELYAFGLNMRSQFREALALIDQRDAAPGVANA